MDHIEPNRWRRLRTLLDRAIELDDESLRAFLDSLHGDDAELRDTLEELLARHSDLRDNTLPNAVGLVLLGLVDDECGHRDIYRRRASMTSPCPVAGVREVDENRPAPSWLPRAGGAKRARK
jgi:hypothetical protein